MFDRIKNVSNNSEIATVNVSRRPSSSFARLRSLLALCLLAVLVQIPVYATDPLDVDPDPDSPTTIVVYAPEVVDTASLSPGYYVIIVVAADGSQESYEVWK